MRTTCIALSLAGLALTIAPGCLVFAGVISWGAHANLMTAGMVLWFLTAPAWFKK